MIIVDSPLINKSRLKKIFHKSMIKNYKLQDKGNFYYNAFFTIFSILSLVINLSDNERRTLKKWIEITAGIVETSALATGYYLQHRGNKLWYKRVDKGATRFLVVVGIYFSIDAAMESQYYGNTKEMVLHALQALGASAYLAASFTTTIGWLIVLGYIGWMLTIGIGLWFCINSLRKPQIEIAFNHMKKQLGAEGHAYYKEYRYIKKLKSLFKSLGQGIEWYELSWRAVIPLYASGYYVKNKKNSDQENKIATSRLIFSLGVKDVRNCYYFKVHEDEIKQHQKEVLKYYNMTNNNEILRAC